MGGAVDIGKKLFDPLNITGLNSPNTPGTPAFNQAAPTRPAWESQIDPATGLLKGPLNMAWDQNQPDQRGIDAFRDRALSTGPSAWQDEALKQEGLQEQGLKNSASQQAASSDAQARSSLASKMGLSPAAQQRLAMQNSRDKMNSLQNVGFQGANQRANIGLQDEQMKNQFLQQLPQQDLAQNAQKIQLGEWNVGNALNEQNAKRAADLSTYNSQMQDWAAQKSGDAMRQSGSGGKK